MLLLTQAGSMICSAAWFCLAVGAGLSHCCCEVLGCIGRIGSQMVLWVANCFTWVVMSCLLWPLPCTLSLLLLCLSPFVFKNAVSKNDSACLNLTSTP